LAEDTKVLEVLLKSIDDNNDSSKEMVLNVGLAGTAMRFLAAYLSITPGNWVLTGSERMKQRPVKELVDALINLGADIEYIENEGYPPLRIFGKKLIGKEVSINGGISSQYISALLMIGSSLETGISIKFIGELISKPYIDMTVNMLNHFGVDVEWTGNTIRVMPGDYLEKNFCVEADWSAASYWYSFVALADKAEITLVGLKEKSLQGDSEVVNIYKSLGVKTEFVNNGVKLVKVNTIKEKIKKDFSNCPDIAQTLAVTAAALNIEAKLTGLKTLRIKETDRIGALESELNSLGFCVEIQGDDLIIKKAEGFNLNSDHLIKTYEDHRMAMAFAPLSLIGKINIEDTDVVKKSYPNFWKDLDSVGFDF
jgi:3-phosphoshikimate 1-carboxyvinyltransferase